MHLWRQLEDVMLHLIGSLLALLDGLVWAVSVMALHAHKLTSLYPTDHYYGHECHRRIGRALMRYPLLSPLILRFC